MMAQKLWKQSFLTSVVMYLYLIWDEWKALTPFEHADDKELIEDIHTQYINKRKPQAKPAVTNSYVSKRGHF